MTMQPLAKSALIGFGIGSLPLLPGPIFGDSPMLPTIQTVLNVLLIPGILVGFALGGGPAHEVNPIVMQISNWAFYAGLSYLVFRIRQKKNLEANT